MITIVNCQTHSRCSAWQDVWLWGYREWFRI